MTILFNGEPVGAVIAKGATCCVYRVGEHHCLRLPFDDDYRLLEDEANYLSQLHSWECEVVDVNVDGKVCRALKSPVANGADLQKQIGSKAHMDCSFSDLLFLAKTFLEQASRLVRIRGDKHICDFKPENTVVDFAKRTLRLVDVAEQRYNAELLPAAFFDAGRDLIKTPQAQKQMDVYMAGRVLQALFCRYFRDDSLSLPVRMEAANKARMRLVFDQVIQPMLKVTPNTDLNFDDMLCQLNKVVTTKLLKTMVAHTPIVQSDLELKDQQALKQLVASWQEEKEECTESKHEPLSDEDALALLGQVKSAMACIHLPGDIKPFAINGYMQQQQCLRKKQLQDLVLHSELFQRAKAHTFRSSALSRSSYLS